MIAALLSLVWIASPADLEPFKPTTEEVAASYRRADTIGATWSGQAFMLRLEPHWIEGGKSLWYRKAIADGTSEFIRVDSSTGQKSPLFDAKRLAEALGKETGQTVDPTKLPFATLVFEGKTIRFTSNRQGWVLDLETYSLRKEDAREPQSENRPPWNQNLFPPSRRPMASPDGAWTARIEGTNVMIQPKGGAETALTTDGTDKAYYARLTWSPDSKRVIAVKVKPGDRKKVYLVRSSPREWGPATLTERVYDRPGDNVDTFETLLLDPTNSKPPTALEPIEYGGWPDFRATKDGALIYDEMDRGYGRFRIFRVDPATGESKVIFDDDPATFVDSTSQIQRYLPQTDEILVSSERDGWLHLYLADGKGGLKQITKGEWVVRSVVQIDETKREILFTASGMNKGEDPYNIHYYRIGLDGKGLVSLTPDRGNHRAIFSPDFASLVDSFSSPIDPPVHNLRSEKTGALIATLESADVSSLLRRDWRAPQPFVAKGRDGKTDIYGLVFRPTNFDPKKSYPVVEDIYAGPQDSFVPKDFSPNFSQQRLAELGFIVVKIDGMGTRNRSKAFHDVCYKNIADAGFPDRILWMQALAKTDPSVDLTRVGIFGTSAGGQNAGGAVLFHPEFYKVAIASCGCHDNRLDKIWWNEQWMGLMGPHYAANSNIDNAGKLQGALMLIVGELDTNVPPESTYRFAAALQAAGKEYEMVVIPNADHTNGGVYGERKRRDFLVRHLHGVEPPNPNRKP